MRCVLHQRKQRAQLFKTPALLGSNGLKSLVIKTKHLTDNCDAPICEEFENAPDFFCNGQRLRDR